MTRTGQLCRSLCTCECESVWERGRGGKISTPHLQFLNRDWCSRSDSLFVMITTAHVCTGVPVCTCVCVCVHRKWEQAISMMERTSEMKLCLIRVPERESSDWPGWNSRLRANKQGGGRGRMGDEIEGGWDTVRTNHVILILLWHKHEKTKSSAGNRSSAFS